MNIARYYADVTQIVSEWRIRIALEQVKMSNNMFCFTDEFGPLKIVHIYEPSIDLKAVLVVDNVARGPAIGGVRMAPDVSTDECHALYGAG